MGKRRLRDAEGDDILHIITTLRNFADPQGDLSVTDKNTASDFANKWRHAVASNMQKKADYYLQKSKGTALKIAREQDFIVERRGLEELTVQERLGKRMHPMERYQKIHDAHGLRATDRKFQEMSMKRMLNRSEEPSGRGSAESNGELYLGSGQYGNVNADSTVVNPLFKGEEVGVTKKMENLIAQQVVQEALSKRCALRAKEATDWEKDVNELVNHARSVASALDNLRTTFSRETTLLSEVAKTVYTFVQSGGNTDGLLPHIALMGEPGIGKTLLAQLLARLLSELGVLMHTTHANVTVTDFVGQYLGQTAPKTEKLLEENLERVVFFDEAYALTRGVQPQTRDAKAAADGAGGDSSDNLYGQEAIDKLVPFLWDERGRMIMIVAGYQHQIEKQFLETNIGLQSRFQLQIVLNPYPAPQMVEIYLKALARGFRFRADTGLRTAFDMFSYRARYLLQAIVEKARQWTLHNTPETSAAAARSLPLPAVASPDAAAAGPSTGSDMVVDGDSSDEEDVGDGGGGGADTVSTPRKSNDKYARRMPSHCDRSYKHLYRLFEAHGRSMDSLASQTRKLVEQSLAQAGQSSELYGKVYLTDVHVLEIFDSQIDAVLGGGDSDTTAVAFNTGTDGGMLTNAEAARLELRHLLNTLELIQAVEDDEQIEDIFSLKEEFPPFEKHMTTVLLGEGTEQLQGNGYTGSMAASDTRSQDDAYLRQKYPEDFGKKAYFESTRANPNYVEKRETYATNTLWYQAFPRWERLRRSQLAVASAHANPTEWRGHDGKSEPLGDFETWVQKEFPWTDRNTPAVTSNDYDRAMEKGSEEEAENYRGFLEAMCLFTGSGATAEAQRKRAASELERLKINHHPGGKGSLDPQAVAKRTRSAPMPNAEEKRLDAAAALEGVSR